jgi:hypothetical protein
MMQKRWLIVAYPERDGNYSLPRKEKIVYAKSRGEAEAIGWREFPEYHEIGVYEAEDL